MESVERFRKRVQRSGVDLKEKSLNEAIRNFDKTLRENPTCFEVQATVPEEVTVTESTREILAMITDIALNDQRTLDEKYIHVSLDTDIAVGCYVKWRDKDWVLTFEEVNGFGTHKTFVMKRCNQIFNFMYQDKVYNIPVSATNLTLYSDGLAEGVYVSRADAKRNVKFGSNPITRLIDLGHRVMLTHKTVFKVTHIDDFSYNGLIGCIVLQTAILPEDDLENNIAFNPNLSKGESPDDGQYEEGEIPLIHGSDEIYLGSSESYITNNNNTEWYLDKDEKALSITSTGNGVCNIIASTDSRYIGKTVLLCAKVDGGFISKEIVIKNYF